MRVPRLLLPLACLSALSRAQDAPSTAAAAPAPVAAAEVTQHDTPAIFNSRVNLVQVPVVVRDKQGHAIGNLTKEDFLLFDKGKPQYIAKFTVEKAGTPYIPAVTATDEVVPDREQPAAAPIPERFVAYLFDDVHLDSGDLARVRQAAWEHIDKTLDPVTRVAVFTTSGIGLLDFTDDRDQIHQALNRIQPNMRMPTASGDCPHMTLYMADLIQNKQDANALAVAAADVTACTNSANTIPPQQLVMTAAIQALTVGESETNRAMDVLKNLLLRMTETPGSRNIVLISPGFLLPGEDLRPAETALLDRAIRSNVTINTLDATGVYTLIPGGNASSRGSANTTNQTAFSGYERDARLAQEDILQELASGTGGTFFHNDNGIKEGLEQLTKQPDFIYLLGFSPADLKYDGNYHALKVSLKNSSSGLNLQSRRGYYAPKRPNDPEEAAREDIREAVFSRDEIQDIPVDLRLQFFKSTPASARLTVISHVDVKNLHYRREQDRSKDTLTLVAGLFDRNGNFVSGFQRIVEMNLRGQTLVTLGGTGLTLRTNFDVTPGNYTIRVVVRDGEGQTMAARNGTVQIP